MTSCLYRFRDIRLQNFKGLTLTFDVWRSSGVEKLYYSKTHICLPIWLLWTTSLYLVPFSRYSTSKFLGFDLELWPLKVIWGQKKIIPYQSPFMTSYLTSMDNISPSRTVFEIFDFQIFRVWLWPWPLTPKNHLGSTNFIPFESSYMTSYLTSMDNISPCRTVFEIFDFKVFRVWPWPLTPKEYLGSENFILFESSYMTSYLTFMGTISLSRTVLEIFDFKLFRVWPWPLTLEGHLGYIKFYTIRKPIYDFLFDFYGQHISISYRFRDIRLQSF